MVTCPPGFRLSRASVKSSGEVTPVPSTAVIVSPWLRPGGVRRAARDDAENHGACLRGELSTSTPKKAVDPMWTVPDDSPPMI